MPFALPRLREQLKPYRLHYFPRLRSTNDHAAAMRKRGDLYAPAVVLAGEQTAGRGRGTHTWWSAAGSLTVTFVLPIDDHIEPHQLPLLAGLSVRNAAAELTGNDRVVLKWPNDVVFDGLKLGGLLCERVLKADLVGIGLNVNLDASAAPAHLSGRVTSLRQVAGRDLDLTDSLACVAAHLRANLRRAADGPFAPLLREYDAHHWLIGRRVCVATHVDEPPVCGRCEGLDGIGRLVLRDGRKVNAVISGQVRVM